MTKEELLSLPFKECGHFRGGGEVSTSYKNEQYGIYKHAVCHVSRDGLSYGKERIYYEYQGKEYAKLDKFLEVIKDVEFIDEIEKP